ncbi:MAG: thiamine biosynthesis protein ThiF [Clostridioides sp.]|jgi:sulfur carrier protein ThiS adenylyltransferase|nr:thiamine biosynthesis protein ThiF [Clostridioides sp.]
MKIYINEIENEVENGMNLFKLRQEKSDKSDVMVLNGFPVKQDCILKENDRVTLIQKGVMPKIEELESLMIARHTPRIHEKLKRGSVAILGLGGLGSNIAISLARIGVGKLILMDYDVVEPSNLNRQQYMIEDIGRLKTEAIKSNIEKINPFIEIEIVDVFLREDNLDILEDLGVDIVVEAFDDPVSKAKLSNYVLKKMSGTYLITSSGMAGYSDSNTIKTRKVKDRFYICGDLVNEARQGEGLMAPRVAICANHMANLTTQILINAEK